MVKFKFEKKIRGHLKARPKRPKIEEFIAGKQTNPKLRLSKEKPKNVLDVQDVFFN